MRDDIDAWTNAIHTGDAFDVLPDLPAESVHACVTDPPYGLNFMGKDWDNFRRKHNDADAGRENVFGRTSSTSPAHGAETEGKRYQEWCERWAREVKRVLKPGGHLLAFSGNRTHHRLFTGVEDAGFEIRDTITWHYGSGFPKASDISKTIDKRADAEREVVGVKPGHEEFAGRDTDGHRSGVHVAQGDHGREWHKKDDAEKYHKKTAPATDAAKEWDGFKTGLKPATEFVVVARKPFDGATVDCVLEHGTGALNIDGTRIEHGGEKPVREPSDADTGSKEVYGDYEKETSRAVGGSTEGRYPSNVVFDETEAERLDRENGESDSTVRDAGGKEGFGANGRDYGTNADNFGQYERGFNDSGGPSRYFYTSKASKAERTLDGTIDNAHPTVKPADLMEWLVTLVTAEDQIVLDPFTGSGTTCRAAKDLGRRFVGIEKQAKWADVARVRAGLTPEDPSIVREDGVTGLEAFTDGGDDA